MSNAARDIDAVDAETVDADLVVYDADVDDRDFQAKMYRAISVQRPAVLSYLKAVRRAKPDASPAELLRELDRRYLATVTTASAGVGASAAIPGVGVPLALGLGAADLLFFYETTALYVLARAEVHGVEVHDAERAKPLVLGVMLGEKSQSKLSKLVLQASGAGSVERARAMAGGTVDKVLPGGWGAVMTQQLPDSALVPLSLVIARESIRLFGRSAAGTFGKILPFGIGAAAGGLASYKFGGDVVKAARVAFQGAPAEFPQSLQDFEKADAEDGEPSRAAQAMQAASGALTGLGTASREKATEIVAVFRSSDVDGDGEREDSRALAAVKSAGSGVKSGASKWAGFVAGVGRNARDAVRRDRDDAGDEAGARE